MANVQTLPYTVKVKDNLWNIVKANGFPPNDWKKVYEAPYNQKLKKARPDPNVIMPGDIINLPKYKPGDAEAILKQVNSAYEKVTDVFKARRQITEDIKKIIKEQEPDFKKIEKLQKDIEWYEQLAIDAAGECEDMYSCIGAGAASMNFSRKASAARDQVDAIEKKMDASGKKQALQKLQKQFEEMHKEQDKLIGELENKASEWKDASVNPY